MGKRREIPQPQNKICPQDGSQYQDFCMDYGCENQDGSGGCKCVQPHECASAIAHKCNTSKALCKIWCDGKCEKCSLKGESKNA